MKAINTGDIFRVYDNSMKTYDALPANSYRICFDPQEGFFLKLRADLVNKEKIYGVHDEKLSKVINAFDTMERSLGVILSGDKGIGKSVFSRMLSQELMKRGIPTIVVDTYYPGIANYIESIDQEIFVLFDEFDKTFGSVRASDGMATPQTEMLGLFDGTSSQKRLYVITCNELRNLSDYIVNRPGRFHYHFRFSYPTKEEIVTYLTDKVRPEYHGEIENVALFAMKVQLNYDCLRAIAFELDNGLSLQEAIMDLNIINYNVNSITTLKFTVFFSDNTILEGNKKFKFFSDEDDNEVYLYDTNGDYACRLFFSENDVIIGTHGLTIPEDKLRLDFTQTYELDYTKEQLEELKKKELDKIIVFSKDRTDNLHYAL